MDRAEVEKKVAEKVGYRREGDDAGFSDNLNGAVLYNASDYRDFAETLWNALIDSELRRAEARELLKDALNCGGTCDVNKANIAAYLKQEENRG